MVWDRGKTCTCDMQAPWGYFSVSKCFGPDITSYRVTPWRYVAARWWCYRCKINVSPVYMPSLVPQAWQHSDCRASPTLRGKKTKQTKLQWLTDAWEKEGVVFTEEKEETSLDVSFGFEIQNMEVSFHTQTHKEGIQHRCKTSRKIWIYNTGVKKENKVMEIDNKRTETNI